MYRYKSIKIKCRNCGSSEIIGETVIGGFKTFTCSTCKAKMSKKQLDELKQLLYAIDDVSDDFDIELYSRVRFREIDIWRESQQYAEDYVNGVFELREKYSPTLEQKTDDPASIQMYNIGLVIGGIREYHEQLRAALREQGISIDCFHND